MVEFRTPPNFDPSRFDGFLNPGLMIIGDSLANGVQSMTIDDRRARLGPANVAARGLGIRDYRHAAYPKVLLADIEDAVDRLPFFGLTKSVVRTLKSIDDNVAFWLRQLDDVRDGSRFWDGLGLAGAVSDDLINKTYGDWRADIDALRDVVLGKRVDDWDFDLASFKEHVLGNDRTSQWYRQQVGGLSDDNHELSVLRILHYAINACFLLNPDNLPDFDHMRFIDLVALRAPKRLVILNGPNHGLFEYTLRGRPERGQKGLSDYVNEPDQLDDLLSYLDALPPMVEKIVLSTMPLPSQTPNLMPAVDGDDFSLPRRPAGQRYYDKYRPFIFVSKEGLDGFTGDQVEAHDKQVEDLCETIVEKAESRNPRIKALPIHRIMERFDSKHFEDRTLKVRAEHSDDGREANYTNRALQRDPFNLFAFGSVLYGGLATLDNHHPSTVGYQQFGNEILTVLEEGEPVPLSDKGDPMLTDPPRGYFWLLRIWRKLGPILLSTGTIDTLRERRSLETAVPDRLDDERIDSIVDELAESEGIESRGTLRAVVVLFSLINDLID